VVSWAHELGIDLCKLISEHPLSRESLLTSAASQRKADKYWSKDRLLARVKANGDLVQPVRQRTKAKSYVFSEAQMQAAIRSLDAGRKQ
jgi:hypothetical protein